jgi:hypothetical protein
MRFQPNITTAGRVVRGLLALALLAGAIFAMEAHWFIRTLLFIGAAFVAFEAARGWCVVRACGIKTRL